MSDELTVREAARRLGCSRSRVRDLLHDGTLRGRKESGRWRVDPSTVRAVVESRSRARYDDKRRVGRERTRWRENRPDPPGEG